MNKSRSLNNFFQWTWLSFYPLEILHLSLGENYMYTLHTRTLERAEVFGNKWAPQSRMIRVIRLNMKKFQILDKTIF